MAHYPLLDGVRFTLSGGVQVFGSIRRTGEAGPSPYRVSLP
jgi:hypothetical protein